jgi:transposase
MLLQRGKAYSQDLRDRVFAASDDGERVGEVADLLRVSVPYVSRVLTRRRTTGETTAARSAVTSRRSWRRSTRRSVSMLLAMATRRSRDCVGGCWRRTRSRRASV